MASETSKPWWKTGLLAALIGAVIPAATFVQGWMQKNRELALQEQQQIQQFRAQYMSVLAEVGVEGMELVADFIADTERDPTIRDWAARQRDKAHSRVAALEKKIEDERHAAELANAAADTAALKTRRLAARAERIATEPSKNRGQHEEAVREAEEAKQELVKAQASADLSEGKLTRTWAALSGRAAILEYSPQATRLMRRTSEASPTTGDTAARRGHVRRVDSAAGHSAASGDSD